MALIRREGGWREVLAGVTLIAIGLCALIVPTVIYALVVSSRQLVASPDAAAAALVTS